MTDEDLLKRFWGNDNKLDTTDKFLRNYILLEGWKDRGVMGRDKDGKLTAKAD